MSDMAERMTKKYFLDVCMHIEGLCADLYHHYSDIFLEAPEASRLWKKTALEEENHRKQFELALLLLNEAEFDIPKECLEKAYSIHNKLLKLVNHVKSTRPDLITAVSKAIEMEEALSELHAHTSIKFKEDSMQKLFKAMSDCDCDHVADLQRYHSVLYLPKSEMSG